MNDINHLLPEIAEGEIPLNENIVKTVALLRQHGFNTVSSGDGATEACECDLPYPYVVIECEPLQLATEALLLHELMKARGVEFITEDDLENEIDRAFIHADYNVSIGICQIQLGFVDDNSWTPIEGDFCFGA